MISSYVLIFYICIISTSYCSTLRKSNRSVENKYHELMKNVLVLHDEDEQFLFRNLESSIIYQSKPTKSPTSVKTPSPTEVETQPPTETPTNMPIRMPEPVSSAPVRFPDVVSSPVRMPTNLPTWKVVPPGIYPDVNVSGAQAKSLSDYACDEPESRKDGILQALSGITDIASLNDVSSPQGMASQWIIENDNMELCPDSSNLLQRYILSLLYFSTNGNKWTRCFENDTDCLVPYNWTPYLSDKAECKWVGTFCNAEGDVTGIIFKRNGQSGMIPTEITNLSFLEALVLEGGAIEGSIPQQIGDLQKLKFMDLSDNSITGEIPNSLYGIDTLVQLDLSHNNLKGPISPQVGSMENLEFLQLEGNGLTGVIPSELGNLNSLQEVTLMNNQFSGNMPAGVCESRDDAGGNLQVLTADCDTDELSCDCCTLC